MAAAGSSVVRRVEELGDLAQAHIQQLSEAAGEDGEGAEKREAGGRMVVQSWRSLCIRAEAAACKSYGSQARGVVCVSGSCCTVVVFLLELTSPEAKAFSWRPHIS